MNKLIFLIILLTLFGCATGDAIVPNAQPTSNTYTCNSVTTQFPYQFGITTTTDMQVFVTTGGVQIKEPSNTYSVDTTNVWVNYPLTGPACPTGSTLLLSPSTPITQTLSLNNRSPFVGPAIMGALDKLTLIDQQIQSNSAGSFWTSNGSGGIYNNNTGYVGIGIQNPRSALDVGAGGITLGGVTLSSWPAGGTVGSSILYGNGAGGFSNVTIGANLTFTGGTLSASGGSSGSGTVSNGTIGNEAVYTGINTVGSGIITDNGSSVSVGGGLTATSFTGSGSGLTGVPTSISSSDGSLSISPTTGSVIANLNLTHANTWTGAQTFNTSAPILGTVTASTPLFVNSSKAIVSGSVSGNTTQVVTTTGSQVSGDCVKIDASGNHIDAGGSCGGNGQWTGTSGQPIYYAYNVGLGTANSAINFLDVAGGVTIGTAYATYQTAPANGALIQGNVGIGTVSAINAPLVVNGQVKTLGSANTLLNTNGGNVGIGTLTPGQLEDVQGTVRALFFQGNGSLLTNVGGSGTVNTSTVNQIPIYTTTTGVTGTAGFVNNGGNMGIGTINPNYNLNIVAAGAEIGLVNNTNSDTSNINFINDLGNSSGFGMGGSTNSTFPNAGYSGTYGAQDYDLMINSSPIVYIKSTNNVGIGTAQPGFNLEVKGSTGANLRLIDTSGASAGPIFQLVNDPGAALVSGNRMGGFSWGGAFDSSHDVFASSSANVYAFANSTWTSTNKGSDIQIQATTPNTGTRNTVLYIGGNGNVGIGTISPATGALQVGTDAASVTNATILCNCSANGGVTIGYCTGSISGDSCTSCTCIQR